MKAKDIYYKSNDGIHNIHGLRWEPEGEVKAILQINHGMKEFVGRYDRFAQFLNEKGFLVIGTDHLGHGYSINDNKDDYGYFGDNGNNNVIEDINNLRKMTEEEYPGVPYYMLGHSMGSFITRQYIMTYGEGLAGVIIMGTGGQPGIVLGFGKMLCKIIAAFKGGRHRSQLLENIAFGTYNKKIKPLRTSCDWLTKDEAIVDAYMKDEKCSYLFTVNGFFTLFSFISFIQKKENIAKIPKDLKLFLVSGEEDPVGNYGKAVKEVYEIYKAAGIKDVKCKLYPTDRHEILNELDYKDVMNDLYDFLK